MNLLRCGVAFVLLLASPMSAFANAVSIGPDSGVTIYPGDHDYERARLATVILKPLLIGSIVLTLIWVKLSWSSAKEATAALFILLSLFGLAALSALPNKGGESRLAGEDGKQVAFTRVRGPGESRPKTHEESSIAFLGLTATVCFGGYALWRCGQRLLKRSSYPQDKPPKAPNELPLGFIEPADSDSTPSSESSGLSGSPDAGASA